MPLPPRLSLCLFVTLVGTGVGSAPAAAQWLAVGRWGDERSFRYVAPGTWMARQDGGTAEMTAEGENHQGRLQFWCSAGDPGGRMLLSGYFGDALSVSAYAQAQPGREPIRLEIDGQPYVGEVEYRPTDRHWVARGILTPQFLDAFAWGSRLDMYSATGEQVTTFRLTGSGAARALLQRVCGI